MKKNNFMYLSLVAVGMTLFFTACKSTDSAQGSYQSAKVYKKPLYTNLVKKSSEYQGPARNPVIFIHGYLGAALRDRTTGKDVWGSFTGRQMMEGFTKQYLRQLARTMQLNTPIPQLPNTLQAVKLLENMKVRVLNVNFRITAYQSIINVLKKCGYIPESQPLPKDKKFYSQFSFFYDWRCDIPENARRLHQFILARRSYLQRKYKKYYGIDNYDVQFDIVAHSMGGLVTRYYLRYGDQGMPAGDAMPKLDWRGSKYVDKAIIVGTPNAGYLDTCIELTRGLRLDPRMPVYPPAVLGTFPSVYQMMPVAGMKMVIQDEKPGKPEVDIYDPKVWIANKWGLADPKQDQILKVLLPKVISASQRRKIAIDHLSKCLKRARKFTEAMSIISSPPEDVMLVLFCGDAVNTRRVATVDPKTKQLKTLRWEAGDGKVLASSARFNLREGRPFIPYTVTPIKWQAILHIQGAHMGIMDSYSFIDNFVYYLLMFPSPKNKVPEKYLKVVLGNKKYK